MGHTASSEPTRRRPPPAPQRQRPPTHDERAYRDRLAVVARQAAERAALELDVFDLAPERCAKVGSKLSRRRDRMLREWRAAASAVGLPRDAIAAGRESHLALAFSNRIRELRAAAGPGGRA